MVSKRHKITNVPLFKKIWDIIDFLWGNHFMIHFSGHFKGASKWLIKWLSRKKSITYVPQFLKQRDINSYKISFYKKLFHVKTYIMSFLHIFKIFETVKAQCKQVHYLTINPNKYNTLYCWELYYFSKKSLHFKSFSSWCYMSF